MIAASGYAEPDSLRMRRDRRSSRCVRFAGDLTTLASMSRPKASNPSPRLVRNRMAASDRLRSRQGLRSPGRYQATTFIPRAWAARISRRVARGRTMTRLCR